MSGTYLGIPLLVWALILWVGVAGTFVTVLVYRVLITISEQDAMFMGPAELRSARRHLRQVDRFLKGFGFSAAGLLAAIAVAWFVAG